jgi:hypothetical protein
LVLGRKGWVGWLFLFVGCVSVFLCFILVLFSFVVVFYKGGGWGVLLLWLLRGEGWGAPIGYPYDSLSHKMFFF